VTFTEQVKALEDLARALRSDDEFIRVPALTREELAVVASYREMVDTQKERE